MNFGVLLFFSTAPFLFDPTLRYAPPMKEEDWLLLPHMVEKLYLSLQTTNRLHLQSFVNLTQLVRAIYCLILGDCLAIKDYVFKNIYT
jgi:hypothetical protein